MALATGIAALIFLSASQVASSASASQASADSAVESAPGASKSPDADAEGNWAPTAATRIVCRQLPQRVGGRIGTRQICATAMQWDR